MSLLTSSASPLPTASPGLRGRAATVLGGSALIAVAAHVAVPFWPVPLTFQTLAVLVLGAIAGPRLGTAAVLAYLAEGIAGLPVFAAGAGPAVLAGPTGGYLVGYVAAAALVGVAGVRGWLGSMPRAVATFCAADALVFGCGLARLATLYGAEKALTVGLAPFLIGEGLKIALAATLVTAGRSFFER